MAKTQAAAAAVAAAVAAVTLETRTVTADATVNVTATDARDVTVNVVTATDAMVHGDEVAAQVRAVEARTSSLRQVPRVSPVPTRPMS